MNPLPLKLNNYEFSSLEVKYDNEYSVPEEKSDHVVPEKFHIGIEVIPSEDTLHAKIQLHISIVNKDHSFPYDLSVSMTSSISIGQVVKLEDRKAFLVDNGLSLMYSALREYIFNVTSRFCGGSIMLPVVSFAGEHAKMNNAVGSAEATLLLVIL